MAAKKLLRFNGPTLPAGAHTWYESNEKGKGVVRVNPGDLVDVSTMDHPKPEHFIAMNMAEWDTSIAAAGSPGK